MYKKLFATSLALALGAGVVGVVAAPATATDSNHAAYWQTLEGESCEKPSFSTENSAVNPYTLPEPDDGWEWSKVVIKAGSSSAGELVNGSYVYDSGLAAGATFVHPVKDSISHVIVCQVPSDEPEQPTVDPEGCVLVAWKMPGWVNSTTPTWPQAYFTHVGTDTCEPSELSKLDDQLLETCDAYYQVDLYDVSATTTSLLNGKVLTGPGQPAEDFPSPSGWNLTYKLVKSPDCLDEDAAASVVVTPASCGVAGTAEFTIVNATWNSAAATTAGTHERTATANDGHTFPGGETTKTVSYTIEAALTTNQPPCAPPAPTFTDSVCIGGTGDDTTGTFTLAALDGITYTAKIGSASYVTVAAGVAHEVPSPDGTTEVTIKAYRGSTLVGEWSHSFSEPNEECYTEVTPIEPAISQAVCTGTPGEVSTAGYTLTAVTGVNYFVKVNGGSWTAATTGSLQVLSPGDEFEIKAVGDWAAGYYITTPGETAKFYGPYTIADPDCGVEIVVGDPVFWSDLCDEINGGVLEQSFEVVAVDHVTYSVSVNGADSTPIAAGIHSAAPGDYVVVTAHPEDGYVLSGTTSWDHAFQTDGFCPPTLGLVTPTVVAQQMTCDADGSYTLGNEEGTPDAILWSVDGGATFTGGGTFTVSTPGAVTITAMPADGAGFAGEDELPYTWNLAFEQPSVCGDLPTLALTGGTIATGSLGLAATMFFAGGLLMFARRRPVTQP
tara:strand:+ start:5000 stop:7168 length:2169 start_codon:yes stop_codon:yes gene_type:complete